MRIVVTSVLVDDQDKALRFYTDVLGFVKKTEVPLGAHRWLTVVSPDDPAWSSCWNRTITGWPSSSNRRSWRTGFPLRRLT